jgi:hypothetical protein
MSCTRAREVDLAAWVVDSEAAEWAEFREHYPGCPECSQEVAGWMRLENSLRAGGDPGASHPPVDELVGLVKSPGSLSRARRGEIENHLKECRACDDQRAALHEFDFSALDGLAPPGTMSRWAGIARSLRGRLSAARSGSARADVGWTGDGVVPALEPEVALLSNPPPLSASKKGGADAPPDGSVLASLEVTEGALSGRIFELRAGENRIGRSRDAEIHLPDSSLARLEARIEAEGAHFRFEALNDRNPARIGGDPVRSSLLHDGDVIEIPGHRLRFRLPTRR